MSRSEITFNKELTDILGEAKAIKYAMAHGALPYAQAKEKVKPLLEKVNAVGKAIAKKYGRKYREIKFVDL